MSADPESISSGRTLPQWLRSKSDNKFDFDTQISPPAHDESFFYIRYPINGSNAKATGTGINSISDAITKADIKAKPLIKKQCANDYGQHTEPCRKYINNKERELTIDNVKHPPKPFGTDDGFKGSGAACGSSIVKVAHRMVSAKSLNRGFTIANFHKDKDSEEVNADFDAIVSKESDNITDHSANHDLMSQQPSRLMLRRGSKSLPASPLSSPRTMRKAQNPYFTGAFSVANNTNAGQSSSVENNGRGWFISSLLGIQRDATSSTSVASHISEEAEEAMTVPKTSNNNVAVPKLVKAKPSELREMNFWTPTSM